MSTRKWFVIKESDEKKRADRRKILEETYGDEAKMPGGIAEPEERNGGHDPGADEQHRQRPAGTGKHECARSFKINEKKQSEWNEQNRFDELPGDGGGARLFSEQSVKSERDAEQA